MDQLIANKSKVHSVEKLDHIACILQTLQKEKILEMEAPTWGRSLDSTQFRSAEEWTMKASYVTFFPEATANMRQTMIEDFAFHA